jgi:hypothetical protein
MHGIIPFTKAFVIEEVRPVIFTGRGRRKQERALGKVQVPSRKFDAHINI